MYREGQGEQARVGVDHRSGKLLCREYGRGVAGTRRGSGGHAPSVATIGGAGVTHAVHALGIVHFGHHLAIGVADDEDAAAHVELKYRLVGVDVVAVEPNRLETVCGDHAKRAWRVPLA